MRNNVRGWSHYTDELSGNFHSTYVDVSGASKVRVTAYKNLGYPTDCIVEGVWVGQEDAPHLVVDLMGYGVGHANSEIFTDEANEIASNTLRLQLQRAIGNLGPVSVTFTVAIYRGLFRIRKRINFGFSFSRNIGKLKAEKGMIHIIDFY